MSCMWCWLLYNRLTSVIYLEFIIISSGHGYSSLSINVHAQNTGTRKAFAKKVLGKLWYWNCENVKKVFVLGEKRSYLTKTCISEFCEDASKFPVGDFVSKALAKRSDLFTIQRSTCMLSEMSRAFGHLVEWSRELCNLSREVWSSAKLSSVVERTHAQLEFIK